MDVVNDVDLNRFWANVDKNGDGECWNWIKVSQKHPYGRIRWQGRQLLAHRVSYQIAFGDFNQALEVLHKCDNPACVNPSHLFLGTQQDNMTDKATKCRQAILKGENNGQSRLTQTDVQEIRQRYQAGESQGAIAMDYGVHRSQIGRIVNFQRWKS